ncbi:MAG: hypothetical protein QM324_06135 [Bacteroidota bacterium]|jgi:hypothetical protein|nr:hypothetical protein [Bacteroidota bacterium]
MKKKFFPMLCAAVAALALAAAFSSCKKDDPVQEETLDFSKLVLAGTQWKVTAYSATLSSGYSMWSHGGDNEISDMLRKNDPVTLKFSTNICSIVEEGQISAPYSWDASNSWLEIGWEEGFENGAAVTFKVEGNYVFMEWDSDVRGALPTVLIKAYIEKSKLTFK